MKCREVKYYLNDYLEGFLIDEIRSEIKLHLGKCRACSKRAEDIKTKLRKGGILETEIHNRRDIWEGISEQNEKDPDFKTPGTFSNTI